ncbi:hypothetical protein EFA46_003125 [Halarchaeum sp. CBA1220]|uniref:hypothetical protein n=1 Tax=Halarchaeum sp. CBA1220 TaxID=1853682 RepID=UPI000F3A8EBA|nr:hypothetical protein [Halarchaeum sp. CBA1220]QLC33241.1 hypothetical protein EFA46_003125 [Halarchaeum sp. CBA1220]
MDDATVFEFKLLVAGTALMVTGAVLLGTAPTLVPLAYFGLVAGLLMLLGGLTDQSARYADE